MKYCNLIAGVSAVALAAMVSVGTLYASPVSVSADGNVIASSVNRSYSDYFDSIREDTLAYWIDVGTPITMYDYNWRTCSFDVSFAIPYHHTFSTGVIYLYRLCTDDDNVLRLYRLAYQPGTYVEYQADFSLIWLVESTPGTSSASSSSGVQYLNCYVNYFDSVFADLSPSIYYSFSASGDLAYVDSSYVSSFSPQLVYSSSSLNLFTPVISVKGRWAAPPMNDYGTYEEGYSAGEGAGYSSGYADGYDDGNSAGLSEGYGSGYSGGYDVGASIGYSSGYGVGWNEGVQVNADFTVVDIWPLLSAIVTMPFTFVQNGLDWNLFSGTPYEFSVNAFFGSLLVLLMVWKVVTLVIKMVV